MSYQVVGQERALGSFLNTVVNLGKTVGYGLACGYSEGTDENSCKQAAQSAQDFYNQADPTGSQVPYHDPGLWKQDQDAAEAAAKAAAAAAAAKAAAEKKAAEDAARRAVVSAQAKAVADADRKALVERQAAQARQDVLRAQLVAEQGASVSAADAAAAATNRRFLILAGTMTVLAVAAFAITRRSHP